MEQVSKLSFKGQSIYIGIDVHLRSWKVSFYTDSFELKTMSMPASVDVLKNYLRTMYPGADYYSTYEAGFCGFWIHRKLTEAKIQNIVVNAADVPTTDKEKKRKRDAIDSRKLAKSLRSSDLEGIYIPDLQQEEDRLLLRSQHETVKKQTRCKNQIKSVLNLFGMVITDEKIKAHWSKAYITHLKNLCRDSTGRSIKLLNLIEELEFHRKTLSGLIKEIRKLGTTPRYAQRVRLLMTIPGIGILTSMVILTEFGNLEIYNSTDKLVGYIGLIPDEHTSGDKEKKSGVTKRGNRNLRRVLVEASWVAIRKDPALMLYYKKTAARTMGSKAIIKVTRKMVNRIRYVLTSGKEYQIMQ